MDRNRLKSAWILLAASTALGGWLGCTSSRSAQPTCTIALDCPSDLTCLDGYCVPFGLNSGPSLAVRDAGQPAATFDAGPAIRVDAGQVDATAARDTGVGPGTAGTACFNNSQCVTGLFCDGMGCGDSLGSCALRPDACVAIYEPVCACDGREYSNRCAASMAGLRVALPNPCP